MADLRALLDDGAAQDVVVHAGNVTATRAEVQDRAAAVAARLDLESGSAVAVQLPNGVDLVATLFGVWAAGGVYVPLNPRAVEREVEHVVAAVDPVAVVRPDGVERRSSDRRYDADVALISFTSGTTGLPKPVPLRHSGVLTLMDGVLGKIGPRRDPSKAPMPNLIPVSLSLWAGLYNLLFALRVGAPAVLMDGFDTQAFADLVRGHGIRSTVLPPAAMTMLVDDPDLEDLAPLRFVRSITAPLSPFQARRFKDRFGISVLNSYGQTELGGEIVGWNAADSREFGDTKLGAVGRPHADVEVRVEDSGELVVRTPALDTGDTSEFADRLTADGWFRTGDVGRVDEDGFVWVEGRVSDMINRGGLKVHPGEVEEVLRLDPSVGDVAVGGVPDERLGEAPWAFVVLRAGHSLDVDALDQLCREHLSPYKVPVRFEPVAALPRNEVGKVLRRDLVTSVSRK